MKHQESERDTENFLYNIKWLRSHYGFSKRKMANMLGIGVTTLNKIEQGIFPPRLTTSILFHIQKIFGIHPKYMFEKIEAQ